MARRRRTASRTSVIDGRAELVVPVDSLIDADGSPMAFAGVTRWLPRVRTYPAEVERSSPGVSLVVDRFAYDLHLSDVGHASDVHDGRDYLEATRRGVAVYVVDGVDPRRSKVADIDAAARDGRVLGAVVTAFEVDELSP